MVIVIITVVIIVLLVVRRGQKDSWKVDNNSSGVQALSNAVYDSKKKTHTLTNMPKQLYVYVAITSV